MIFRNSLVILFSICSFLLSCKGQNTKNKLHLADSNLKVGQIWKYKNRTGEDSSTVTILKIEKYEKGDTIIHIRVDNIKIYSPQSATGFSNVVDHLPYSKNALLKSITKLVGQTNDLPDFSEGYNLWKEAWDSGAAGYWTTDLKEAINGVDKNSRSQK